MGNFLNGLLLLVCGAVLWVVASVVGGFEEFATGGIDPVVLGLMAIGFVVMIGGPVWYWIVVPIRNRRKSSEHRW